MTPISGIWPPWPFWSISLFSVSLWYGGGGLVSGRSCVFFSLVPLLPLTCNLWLDNSGPSIPHGLPTSCGISGSYLHRCWQNRYKNLWQSPARWPSRCCQPCLQFGALPMKRVRPRSSGKSCMRWWCSTGRRPWPTRSTSGPPVWAPGHECLSPGSQNVLSPFPFPWPCSALFLQWAGVGSVSVS